MKPLLQISANRKCSTFFLRWCWLGYWVIFSGLLVGAQESLPRETYFNQDKSVRVFEEADWKEAVQGINYNDEFVEEDLEEEEEEIIYENNGLDSDAKEIEVQESWLSPFWMGFFKVLFVLIVIGLVALLAYYAFGADFRRPRNRKVQATVSEMNIEEIEERIHESDLDSFIQTALAQNDYPLAIRLYYLAAIKELSLNQYIHWKKDKTNRDYQIELRDTPLSQPFRQLTMVFERVWYGEALLRSEDFLQVQPAFEQFIQSARQKVAS